MKKPKVKVHRLHTKKQLINNSVWIVLQSHLDCREYSTVGVVGSFSWPQTKWRRVSHLFHTRFHKLTSAFKPRRLYTQAPPTKLYVFTSAARFPNPTSYCVHFKIKIMDTGGDLPSQTRVWLYFEKEKNRNMRFRPWSQSLPQRDDV